MKKRMLAMLLCMAMVLSLLPMAALAAEDDVLYVGDTNVIGGGYWKGDGAGGLTAGSESDYTVWYNPSTNTLTLKDASITKAYTKHIIEETTHDVYSEIGIAQKLTGYSEEIEMCGIYSSLALNICLVGTNTITLEKIDSSVSNAPTDRDFVDIRLFSYGIYACEETYTELGDGSGGYTSTELLPITISGSGSCSVSASEVNAKDMAQVQTFGLCAKSLVINNSELTVSGGSAIGAEEDPTLVKGSGNVYTTGIWARTVTINNGSVVAFGGTAQGGSETISQGITGPFWQAAVTLNGGSLESRGGSIPGTAGRSMGIGGYITLNGGVVKAFGGTVTAGTTVGIMTGGSSLGGSVDMKINAGTLIAASGKNEDANGEQYAVQYWSTTITPPAEYWWRTAETDAYNNGAETAFSLVEGQTYVEITTTAPSGSDNDDGDVTPPSSSDNGDGDVAPPSSSDNDEGNVVPPTTYSIAVLSVGKGNVTVSPKSAAQGDTVTITATPDTGYQLNKLTVTDKNGSSIKLADKGNGIYTFTMPDSEAFVVASFTELELPALVLPFTDVTASDWFYDAVAYVYDNGLMTGTSDTTFSPKATTTRGMIVTILHRLEGCPAAAASGFADVKSGAWYQEAVDWAAANGIVNGTSQTTFAPTSPITREQMAAILYRYAAYKGYDVSQLADLNRFSDSSAVSSYAADALAWANAAGLITGVTDTALFPQGSAVRAQAATILMRFCENIAQ